MSPAWIALGTVLTLFLIAFAVGHLGLLGVFLLSRRRSSETDEAPIDPVTVGIPARNEGEGAVRAIRSVLDQDHAGPITVVLLLKDRSDTSIPYLQAAFPDANFEGEGLLFEGPLRRAHVHFTGEDPKHRKVNLLVDRLDTPFVALLDCDHQAFPSWIRTSLAVLRRDGGKIVQSRREPISTEGLFGLWDSLHQHIGCEVTNIAYDRLGLSVFFTGTTAVMESELLRNHPLRDCLTEDTDLSYRLILAGERILYNPVVGSKEEVSPDLYSFLARRRRWAHGHTEAFLTEVKRLFSVRLGLRQRLQFLFHGAHYLLVVPVFFAQAWVALSLWPRLTPPSQLAAIVLGAFLAYGLVRTQKLTRWWPTFSLFVGITAWLFPAMVILFNALMALLLADPQRLSLPGPWPISALGLIGFLAPLLILLAAMAGFRQLGWGSGMAVIASYPVAFYMDVSGVLIGLLDYVQKRRTWLAVARSPTSPDSPPRTGLREGWSLWGWFAAARNSLRSDRSNPMKPSRWLPPLFVIAVVSVGAIAALPERKIPLAARDCQVLEADGHPWIVPAAKLAGYCGPATEGGAGTRTGSFSLQRNDTFASVDTAYWDRLDDTFFCNQAMFTPDNVVLRDDGGLKFRLLEEARGDRAFTSGSIATKKSPDAKFLYGRFEVEMKPAKVSGTLTAFFLYRFDPWQEIDLEFLGKDTTKVMVNVFYNPGEEGDLYNYGFRGTPVLVDLGFDAAEAFHTYAIEWDPNEIRWFVDDVLIHARPSGKPTPVPHLPMRFHLNTWPICSEELAGPMDKTALPAETEIKQVSIYSWAPPLEQRLFGKEESSDWRSGAQWMQ